MREFSLFEGDPLSRFFLLFGIRSRGVSAFAGRFLFLLIVTFLPTAFFCLWSGFGPGKPRALNFFADAAALSQAFLGYPMFIIAEMVIGIKTRTTAKHFSESGLVQPADLGELDNIHEKIAQIRHRLAPDLVCLFLAFACSGLWLWEEVHNSYDTWHALGAPGVQSPTLAGWWVALVGIPIFNYWWLRWIWKVSIWCYYLRRVSKLDLRLIASHPDMTGGLGFLSSTQGSFAILVFAFGIGIIAPLIGYKVDIENASLMSFSVGGPLVAFVIGAPLFFTLPLLFFTKRLSRVKKRAEDAYQDRATEAALYFEKSWLTACSGDDCSNLLGSNLSAMNNLNQAYNHIKLMRVVPFDTRSFSQLTASTFGSLLPLLPKFFDIPEPVSQIIEALKPLFGK
ncbi:MAG: hypothetical protein J5J00_14060 [Deltaproteobacteria bacterium]|nr:hypothetical protein [Deltaproteobacteria bacterium]